jgi:large subunit ribosomal protein L21
VGAPFLDGAKVECKVTEHTRGDKVRVFKMKSKKHYHRTAGFRAAQTKLEVTSISA